MATTCTLCFQTTAANTPLDRPCTLHSPVPCWACYKLTNLDVEIAELETKHTALINQRVALKLEVNQLHDSLLSKIPPEVTSSIFLWCTPMAVNPCWHSDSCNAMAAEPLIFGAVCRGWRQIAWSTPALWSSISIDVYRRKAIDQIPGMAQEWLDRAGELPLSINLYTNVMESSDSVDLHTVIPIIDVVIAYSRRWQHVSLKLPHIHLLRICDNREIEPPSSLQSVHICRTDRDPPDLTPALHLNSRHSPRVVRMCCLEFKYLDIEWENLVFVKFGVSLPITTCFKLLQTAPRLQHCDVRIMSAEPSETVYLKTTTHPELQTLRLGSFFAIDLPEQFLGLISLPALRSFAYCDRTFPFVLRSMVAFLSRSSLGVTKLSLGVYGAMDDQEIKILRATPSLTDLTLTHIRTTETLGKLIKNLADTKRIDSHTKEALFLPNLQSLTIEGPKPFSWYSIPEIFDVQAVVSPECNDGSKLRPLHALTLILNAQPYSCNYMVFTDGLGIENVRQFVELRKQGIDLKIIKQNACGSPHELISKYVDEWKL